MKTQNRGSIGITSLSRHAQVRMQQRCIPRWLPDFIVCYGAKSHSHDGACIFHLHDKQAQAKAKAVFRARGLTYENHWHDAYIVAKAGRVLTAGWRQKPIRRLTQRRAKCRRQS